MRQLKQALTRRQRAGEAALFVAKKLRFNEVLLHRAAVKNDEGLRRARRQVVQRARHDLLARARFAFQHHGRARWRHFFHRRHQPPHGFRLADKTAELAFRARPHVQLLRHDGKPQRRPAQPQRAAGAQPRLAHPHAVDVSARDRAQVLNQEGIAVAENPRVMAADAIIVQHEVIVFQRAKRDVGLVKDVLGGAAVRARRNQLAAAKRQRSRRWRSKGHRARSRRRTTFRRTSCADGASRTSSPRVPASLCSRCRDWLPDARAADWRR